MVPGKPFVRTPRAFGWVDLAFVGLLAAFIYALATVAREWSGPLQPVPEIHLEVRYLPLYALFSLSRGVLAYGVSFLFTMVYGYTMARVAGAERVMLPVLDILQSIPVLGFLPGYVLGLVHLFPHQNLGLEIASVLMIFTGQVWNMTFSFYSSLKSVPPDLVAVARLARMSWWERFFRLDLSFAATGLLWNSMMSMAGGWFFHRRARPPAVGPGTHAAATGSRTANARRLPIQSIPTVSLSGALGLLEVIENQGRLELFELTRQVDIKLTQLLLVVKAAEVLGWVTTPGGRVEMTAEGRQFLAADITTRKERLNTRLRGLFVFDLVLQMLQQSTSNEVDEAVVLSQLALTFPHERPLRILRTVVAWARYAALFKYNSTRRVFHGLQRAAAPP